MARVNLTQKPEQIETEIKDQFGVVQEVEVGVQLANTPIIWGFQSEQYFSSSTYAQLRIQLFQDAADTVNVGDTLTILGQTFTATDNISSADQFYAGTAGVEEFIHQTLANAINSNINLAYRYSARVELVGSRYQVLVSARFPGESFNFGTPTSSGFGAYDPYYLVFPAVSATRAEKLQNYLYEVYLKIFIGRQNTLLQVQDTFTLDTELARKNNGENQFQFNIQQILNSELDYYYPPAHNGTLYYTTGFYLHKPGAIQYALEYGESFIGGLNPLTLLPIDPVEKIENQQRQFLPIGEVENQWAIYGAKPLNINQPSTKNLWDRAEEINLLTDFDQTFFRDRDCNYPWFISILGVQNPNRTRLQLRIWARHYGLDNQLIQEDATGLSTLLENGNLIYNLAENNMPGLFGISEMVKFTEFYIEEYDSVTDTFKDYSPTYRINWNLNVASSYKERLYWRNSYGQVEQWDFRRVNRSIETESTGTLENNIQLDDGNFRNIGRNKEIQRVQKETIELESQNITQEYYQVLQNIGSALDHWIFIEGEPNYFEKVMVESISWEQDSTNSKYTLNLTISKEKMNSQKR